MLLKHWDALPSVMQTEAVRPYYDILERKKISLIIKRCFDVVGSVILLIVLSPLFAILAVWIKLDSKGSIFYRQCRITQYFREFKIFKFRTMILNADTLGSLVTVDCDNRITNAGRIMRKLRLDELPQLINVLIGDMTFVGTRPEVQKYVKCYTDEMLATLLLPAGVTSQASIAYKDEMRLLTDVLDVNEMYINEILPKKMKYNLDSLRHFTFAGDLKIILSSIYAVLS